MTTRRVPSGAAVLRPEMTAAITEAVLDELAEQGFSRLSMEAVAKRAGVGKSALYRRWASKQDMALAVIAEFSVAKATFPDTGSLRGDMRAALDALMDWLTHPRFSRILPDLVAEMARNPELAALVESMTGGPRRDRAGRTAPGRRHGTGTGSACGATVLAARRARRRCGPGIS